MFKILSNTLFYFVSELFGRYTVHIETTTLKRLGVYRLFYGVILCGISVYLMEGLTREKALYVVLLFGLTVSRILVNNEQNTNLINYPWFSSFHVPHIPFSVNLSLVVSIGLFYQDLCTEILYGAGFVLVINFMYGVRLYCTRGVPFTPVVLTMVALDLLLELLPLIGPSSLIPSVLVEEIVQIVFYSLTSTYLRKSRRVNTTTRDTLKYFSYFTICSMDLIIESYRSSNKLMLVCSYISEAIVFWSCYYYQVYFKPNTL
jgi:hypothetical protein